jgi:large subunit ribosomal protein L21e
MPHANGYRARTRFMFSRAFRQKGVINLSTYLKSVKVGDLVDIVANAAVHKGMPHKFYHGRTGTVFNVTPRAVGVEVNKQVCGCVPVSGLAVPCLSWLCGPAGPPWASMSCHAPV